MARQAYLCQCMPQLSLLFVVLAMVWSWSWAAGSRAPLGSGQLGVEQRNPRTEAYTPSEAVHTGLQDDLLRFLGLYARQYLQASQAQVKNLSTQYVGKKIIEATFELHYTDASGDALQHRGQATLHQQSRLVWQLRHLQLHNKAIEFSEEILIEIEP